MAMRLVGAPVAKQINQEIHAVVAALALSGIVPCLAIVRVGSNGGDIYYENSAAKRAESCGIRAKRFTLSETDSPEKLLDTLDAINRDPDIHGCLLLRPLPKRFPDHIIRNRLSPIKDVDGITDASLCGVFTDMETGFAPCTAEACIRMLRYYDYPIAGKHAVVIGRSLVIGKPVAMLLLQENATVTICHSKTDNLPAICRGADLIVAAAGQKEMLSHDYLSPGQTVIDVGVHTDESGGIYGDVNCAAAEAISASYTPVPGGLGTVTTAVLLLHTVVAAQRQRNG